MITAMAASSLPSLEADEEGGLFFLALRAPCIIWSLRVMLAFPLLLLWRCLCLQGFGLVKINCEMKNILLEL